MSTRRSLGDESRLSAAAERSAQPPSRSEGPRRTCVGCRRTRPTDELVRLVRMPDGGLGVGRHLPGRGAWICAGSPACVEAATRRRVLARALRGEISTEALADLRSTLDDLRSCDPR